MPAKIEHLVHIPVDSVHLEGMLAVPDAAPGIVLFAHGSGSSRHSPRNNYVAGVLRECSIGTLLMDLLTPQEDSDYQTRFDIRLLTHRLLAATRWMQSENQAENEVANAARNLPIGYFGASTGAAAALQAAAQLGQEIGAVVSRGGRPDLAGQAVLEQVRSPTLLLVGGLDDVVIGLNRAAYACMRCTKEFSIVPGATHLFDEPGTLEQVAQQAAAWFSRYLKAPHNGR